MQSIQNRFANIVSAGLRAQSLATESDLGPRLPEGLLDSLKQDLNNLSDLNPGADVIRMQVKALTGKQQVACKRAVRRVAAIRKAVVRQTRNPDSRRDYGVGERLSPGVVREVVRGLRVIIARMESHPEEARSFGLFDEDLAELRALVLEVVSTDQVQEQARVDRPGSTRQRDAAIRRVARAVGIISALGVLRFADDDAKRELFEALASNTGGAGPAPPPKKESAPEVAAEK